MDLAARKVDDPGQRSGPGDIYCDNCDRAEEIEARIPPERLRAVA